MYIYFFFFKKNYITHEAVNLTTIPAFWTFDQKVTRCTWKKKKNSIKVHADLQMWIWKNTMLLPLSRCLLCKYWQARMSVKRKMDNKPREQISTAHRYTSATERHQTPSGSRVHSKIKQQMGHGFKLYLQTGATPPRRPRPQDFCGLEGEVMEKSTQTLLMGANRGKRRPDKVFL